MNRVYSYAVLNISITIAYARYNITSLCKFKCLCILAWQNKKSNPCIIAFNSWNKLSCISIYFYFIDTYSTRVEIVSFTPIWVGQKVQFLCNITEIGYPATIERYEWFIGNRIIHESNKYHGINSNLMTIQVSKVTVWKLFPHLPVFDVASHIYNQKIDNVRNI